MKKVKYGLLLAVGMIFSIVLMPALSLAQLETGPYEVDSRIVSTEQGVSP